MDVLSMFEKLKGIWSVENEESGRSNERGMQRQLVRTLEVRVLF